MKSDLSRGSVNVSPRENRIKRFFQSLLGLCVCSVGIYLSVVANIGMSPWDALNMGVSNKLPLSFGTVSALIGFLFVFVSRGICKEPIGISTILDPLVCGPMADLWISLNLFEKCTSMWSGALVMCLAMVIVCTGQWIYMKSALGCGPRDSFMIVIARYFPRIPIGVVNGVTLGIVIILALLLDGPIGLGTAITVLIWSVAMQSVFKVVHFEPRDIKHERINDTIRCVFGHQAE